MSMPICPPSRIVRVRRDSRVASGQRLPLHAALSRQLLPRAVARGYSSRLGVTSIVAGDDGFATSYIGRR